MSNDERQQSFKRLVEMTLRYDRNQIIHPNPDIANRPEDELILEKVPELVTIMTYGKSKERVHAAFGLKNMSDEKRFRIPLCLTPEFVESICAILFIEQNSDVHRRCQQHALAILNNLLLEDPVMDSFIANDENFLPGLSKMLCSHEKLTQELATKCLDYVSVVPDNQTFVVTFDGMMKAIVQLLKNTRSIEARSHCLQALVYLSENVKNRFTIARTKGMLDELKNCISFRDSVIPHRTIQVIYNICLLKENIPVIAKHSDLRIAIKARNSDVQDRLNLSKEEYQGYQNDIDTFKLTGVVLDMLYTYDTRLNTKFILRGEGFNNDTIVIGKHISKSIVGFAPSGGRDASSTFETESSIKSEDSESFDGEQPERSGRVSRLSKHRFSRRGEQSSSSLHSDE